MCANIEVRFQLRAEGCGDGQKSVKTFTDWYAFADWLKQEEENQRVVLIYSWKYVHAVKQGV